MPEGTEEFYPPGPSNVRPDFTRASAAYKRHTYLAVAGVVLFLVAYFALAGWLAWTAYHLFTHLTHTPAVWVVRMAGGLAAAFLAFLMFKAVFFIRKGELERDIEVTAKDHPKLFAFLYRLADEARAPRPHRVFLSPRVNAGVYYDLSLANLLFPSKKNLEIGLGLINVLTLAEIKAVLAHEFGHFAQRTMAVGRWIYTAQQIAGHFVARRDAIDNALQRLSNVDVRIAWIGWLLRGIVWSIRSLISSAFGWVVLASRALSREMELQADRVAVSLTGSDALVHALHRTEAADDAMDQAISFADDQREAGKAIADLFAIQSEMIVRMRAIVGEKYATVPPLPDKPETHRLFKEQFAHPPRMWSTHPPNNIREENAKQEYLSASLDDRSAWVLFEDPERTRRNMTEWVFARIAQKLPPASRPNLLAAPLSDSLQIIAKKFDRRFFDAAYRGVYLFRSCVRAAENVGELYGAPPSDVKAALHELYPETLSADLDRWRMLSVERAMLNAVERGILDSSRGKLVRYHGQDYHRRALPELIARVDGELTAARAVLTEHDRRVRTTHRAAARDLSVSWEAYLKGLLALIHYTEHREADLADVMGVLGNSVAIALADGRVSQREMADVMIKARVVYAAFVAVHNEALHVHLGSLTAPLKVESYTKLLGENKFTAPTPHNIGAWLDAVHGWVGAARHALSTVSEAALDELLRAEKQVAELTASGDPVPPTPEPPRAPVGYTTLVIGKERPRQKLGWWERFVVADGIVPGAARALCAGGIIGLILLAGYWEGLNATVYVVNGLNRPVVVKIADDEVQVPARSHLEVDVEPAQHVWIQTRTKEGHIIEGFDAEAASFGNYIYDVARASPLVELDLKTRTEHPLHVTRWSGTSTKKIVEDRDDLANEHDTTGTITFGAGLGASAMIDAAGRDAGAVALAHMQWDPPGTLDLERWFYAAQDQPEFSKLLAERLATAPDDVMARRFEQQVGPHDEVCARHRKRAAELPDSPGWQYLAARCNEDPATRSRAYLDLMARWPDDPWIAYVGAAASADAGDFEAADRLLVRATKDLPELRTAMAVMRARVARISGKPISKGIFDQDPMLGLVRDVEHGNKDLSPDKAAFGYLYRGNLTGALNAARDTDRGGDIALLVACSEGATHEQAARGHVDPARVSLDNAIYAYALALRDGHDPAPYRLKLPATDVERLQAFTFVDQVHAAAPDTLEQITPPSDYVERAAAYAAATVLLGDRTPPAWRMYAMRALFVFERPYFR